MTANAARGRRMSAKAQATRDHLVVAATRMFAERGYDGTSVRALGDELGMTTGAIYAHFKSKADLLAAVVADAIADQIERPEDETSRTYGEGAASLFARYRRQATLRSLLLEATAAAKADDAVREQLRDVQAERLSAWAASAGRDKAAGRVAADVDADTLVKLLWALEFGLVVFDVFGIDPPDAERTAAIVARLIEP